MKRIALFILTNLLVMLMLGIAIQVFGLTGFGPGGDLNLVSLLIIAAIVGFGGSFISLALSKVMAKWMMGVQILHPQANLGPNERWLIDRVHEYSRLAGLNKMPEVGIYDSPEANAFATGPSRNNSLVAVSTGLLGSMTQEEVEGVLAHEVAHIQNGDMVTMTLLQGVINTFVVFLSRIVGWIASRFVNEDLGTLVYFVVSIVFQIIFSILGSMVVMAFSRHREFHADAGAAALAGKHKMIAALQRLQSQQDMVADKQPAYATMQISSRRGMMALFASHPPLEDRIAALRNS